LQELLVTSSYIFNLNVLLFSFFISTGKTDKPI
jgi:hypothetical protein